MGDRGQVKVLPAHENEYEDPVFLYTHGRAHELADKVREAVARGSSRWSDYEYLARVIFCEMVRDDLEGTTNYGIGTHEHGDVWRVVEVDCAEEEVRVIDHGTVEERYNFSEAARLVEGEA